MSHSRKKHSIKRIFLITMFFLSSHLRMAFSQNPNSSEALSAETVKNVVKEAIKEEELEKEKNRAQLASTLKSRLNLAIHEWIYQAEKNKEPELNKLAHRIWEISGRVTYPVPYDYYLRGYEYIINKQELATDPLINLYKADIAITEKQFIENYHHADASDPSQYFYTVSTPIKIKLEYQQDKFVIINLDYDSVNIKRGW